MAVGRPAMLKSPAMKAVIGPLEILANKAIGEYKTSLMQYKTELEFWKIRNKACEEVYKSDYKSSLKKKLQSQK